MANILRIKNADGEWVDVPAIIGPKGDTGESGYTPVKGVDYFDGQNGVPCTHSWNGTTLTVTSASGTSSANLKGDKGDKGDPGTVDTSVLNNYVSKTGDDTISGIKTFTKRTKTAHNPNFAYQLSTGNNVAELNLISFGAKGAICITMSGTNCMFDLEFAMSSYAYNVSLHLSGGTYYEGASMLVPNATGVCGANKPKVRTATDANGRRCWLIGEATTDWGGWCHAVVPRITAVRMGGETGDPADITMSLVSDETGYTIHNELPLGSSGGGGESTKIANGTYTGTGTFGAANPNTLTFDFEPKFIMVQTKDWDRWGVLKAVRGVETAMLEPLNSTSLSASYTAKLNWSGNTVSFWSTNSVYQQLNVANTVYYYTAIG